MKTTKMISGTTRPLHEELDRDPFYQKCCLCGTNRVQRHHNLIYARNKVEEAWCILPLCPFHHEIEKRRDIHEKLDWIMLSRAKDEDLLKYSKIVNLVSRKKFLIEKYGIYKK